MKQIKWYNIPKGAKWITKTSNGIQTLTSS